MRHQGIDRCRVATVVDQIQVPIDVLLFEHAGKGTGQQQRAVLGAGDDGYPSVAGRGVELAAVWKEKIAAHKMELWVS